MKLTLYSFHFFLCDIFILIATPLFRRIFHGERDIAKMSDSISIADQKKMVKKDLKVISRILSEITDSSNKKESYNIEFSDGKKKFTILNALKLKRKITRAHLLIKIKYFKDKLFYYGGLEWPKKVINVLILNYQRKLLKV